jgi:hypothetical protein
MTSAPNPSQHSGRLLDSPWFWLTLFSATGLAALLLIGPKYAQRQRIIEYKYRADQARGRPQAADQPPHDQPASPGPTDELLIPLWPLVVLSAVVFAASLAALVLSRRKQSLRQPRREVPG